MKKIYNNDDIQNMLVECHNNETLTTNILDQIRSDTDRAAIQRAINEKYYEVFDRYDSDVCERFIRAYENATK